MNQHRLRTLLAISFVIGIVIFFHFIGWLRPAEIFFRALIIPASSVVYQWSFALHGEEEKFERVEDLEAAYRNLKERQVKNAVDRVKLQSLEEENETLRRELSFLAKSDMSFLSADVVGKNIDPIGSTLLLRVPEDAPVHAGNPVIMEEGIFIGVISKKEDDIATVRLIDDSQSKIAATLQNKEKSIGVVEGGYGLSIRMNFIPQDENIHVDDVILTSGIEANIPYGLPIGKVEAIEKEPYQPFQSAVVVPFKSLRSIRHVQIILSSASAL